VGRNYVSEDILLCNVNTVYM